MKTFNLLVSLLLWGLTVKYFADGTASTHGWWILFNTVFGSFGIILYLSRRK
jgi:hypothetical protein